MDVKGSKGNWIQAKTKEHISGGFDWYNPQSQPVKTLFDQKPGTVTINSFFNKLGEKFLGLK